MFISQFLIFLQWTVFISTRKKRVPKVTTRRHPFPTLLILRLGASRRTINQTTKQTWWIRMLNQTKENWVTGKIARQKGKEEVKEENQRKGKRRC